MEQLSFKFLKETVSRDELINEANVLAFQYNELLRKLIPISGEDALNMAARGDFYDTDFEGSLLHSKLQRLVSMLNWK